MTATDVEADELLSALEVTQASGASYRQLDYWVRTKLVRDVDGVKGSGNARRFTPAEVQLVKTIARATTAMAPGTASVDPFALFRRHNDAIRHALHSGARWMVLTPERAYLEEIPFPIECGWFIALTDDIALEAAS